MLVAITCAHCRRTRHKKSGAVNRSRSMGAPLYCSRRCAGLARRINRPKSVRVAMKAEYDRKRRERLRDVLREKHREYHKRTYDPAKARERRKMRSKWHAAYCRRYYADPKRKARKQEYDAQRRAELQVGPEWSGCFRLLIALEKEIRSRQSSYERRVERGYYTRSAQQRRRDAQVSRW